MGGSLGRRHLDCLNLATFCQCTLTCTLAEMFVHCDSIAAASLRGCQPPLLRTFALWKNVCPHKHAVRGCNCSRYTGMPHEPQVPGVMRPGHKHLYCAVQSRHPHHLPNAPHTLFFSTSVIGRCFMGLLHSSVCTLVFLFLSSFSRSRL